MRLPCKRWEAFEKVNFHPIHKLKALVLSSVLLSWTGTWAHSNFIETIIGNLFYFSHSTAEYFLKIRNPLSQLLITFFLAPKKICLRTEFSEGDDKIDHCNKHTELRTNITLYWLPQVLIFCALVLFSLWVFLHDNNPYLQIPYCTLCVCCESISVTQELCHKVSHLLFHSIS